MDQPNTLASRKWLAEQVDAYLPTGKTFNAMVAGYSGRYRVARIEKARMWVADSRDGTPRIEDERAVIVTKSNLVWCASTGNLLSWRQDAYEAAPVSRAWMSSYEPIGNEPFAPGEE